jgi:hypothetical protein
MTYNSITIANYFIKKYGENGRITPLKLIKLTYIAYGWYLALNDNKVRLINEKPEAWRHGPVFPNLYNRVKEYGKSDIKDPIDVVLSDTPITDDDALFLDRIWEIYGKNHDGVYLSAITHTADTPWSEIYPKGYNLEIPDDIIFEHYKSKVKPKEAL